MKKLCTFFLTLAASVGMSWAMQIYINVPEQDLLTLEVEPSGDIAVVKDKIQDNSGGEEEEGDAIVINTNEVLSGYTKETITITCENKGDYAGFKLSGAYTASISNSDASKHIEKN